MQLRFCLNEFLDVLKAPLHQAGDAILYRFIDRHVGSDRKSRATLSSHLDGGPSVNLHRPVSREDPRSPVGLILHNFHCASCPSGLHARRVYTRTLETPAVACCEVGGKEFSDGKRTYGRDARRRNAYVPTTVRPAPSRGSVHAGGGACPSARRDAFGRTSTIRAAIHLHKGGGQRRGWLRSFQLRMLGDKQPRGHRLQNSPPCPR